MLRDLDGKIIKLQGSLLGFRELDEFELRAVDNQGVFSYLQSLEDENIGFVVTSPFSFYPDYAMELDQAAVEELELSTNESVLVLVLLTVKEPFQVSTINLLAPIILNIDNWKARQIVLPPHYNYQIKTPLHKSEEREELLDHADSNS